METPGHEPFLCNICLTPLERKAEHLVCPSCEYDAWPLDSVGGIFPSEAKKKLDKGELVLVDVREPDEFDTCRIKPSKFIPMRFVPKRMAELDKKSELVIYCHHGNRSAHVTRFLRQKGFGNVKNLVGGINRWTDEVDTSLAKY